MINLNKLRNKRGFSQEYLANKISVSRQTFSQIEKGTRELNVSEAQILANIFDLSLSDFLEGKDNIEPKVISTKLDVGNKMESGIRISIPQKNLDKFKEVLLYVLEKMGARPNIGETVIYKLLYFIDFDYYEKFEEQLIGATYIKNHYGPTPIEFKKIINDMLNNGDIEIVKSKYFQYPQRKYLPLKRSNLKVLSAIEKDHIDEVLFRLGNMTAAEISKYSHGDIPWKSHKVGEKINYDSVFYRDNKYSVRQYEDSL